jgi:hypothetical protein
MERRKNDKPWSSCTSCIIAAVRLRPTVCAAVSSDLVIERELASESRTSALEGHGVRHDAPRGRGHHLLAVMPGAIALVEPTGGGEAGHDGVDNEMVSA